MPDDTKNFWDALFEWQMALDDSDTLTYEMIEALLEKKEGEKGVNFWLRTEKNTCIFYDLVEDMAPEYGAHAASFQIGEPNSFHQATCLGMRHTREDGDRIRAYLLGVGNSTVCSRTGKSLQQN